jgi:hypothetical protein
VEYIGEVHCGSAGALPNLLAAAEAIRHDYCFRRGASHSGQQDALSYRLRDGVLVSFKPKGSGHSTAARIRTLYFGFHAAQ